MTLFLSCFHKKYRHIMSLLVPIVSSVYPITDADGVATDEKRNTPFKNFTLEP
jgi:hypothetical protein